MDNNMPAQAQPATPEPTKVEFTPPKDASLPETASNGKEFDVVCSFKLAGDKLCMTKFGEASMPCGDEKAEPKAESKPDYSDYSGQVQAGMGTQ